MKQYTKFVIFSFLIGSINMYISKVSLVNYRNFENSFFLFNKGINTIIGEMHLVKPIYSELFVLYWMITYYLLHINLMKTISIEI